MLDAFLGGLIFLAGCLGQHSKAQTVIAFQSFESNSVAVAPEDPIALQPELPGVLTTGQQELELVDTGLDLENGNSIFQFTQPSETFNFASPDEPLPSIPTGRVFDSDNGSLPWTLTWANSRVPGDIIPSLVASQEAADEIMFALLGFPMDLNYVPIAEEINLGGPVVLSEDLLGLGLAVSLPDITPIFVEVALPGQIGPDGDETDAFGVSTIDRLAQPFLFEAPVDVPDGNQFFFAADGDGLLSLDFDAVDPGAFPGLLLQFDLAVGDTGYEEGDRFAVVVNGETVLDLEETFNPVTEEVDSPLEDAPNSFATTTLDLSSFAGADSLEVSFLMDSSAGTEAFALDNIKIIGLDSLPPSPGDYNGDGAVDALDYTAWRETFGQFVGAGIGADGNFDGQVNEPDFGVWAENFGVISSASSQSVPEPTTIAIGLLAAGLAASVRRS